MKSIKVNDTVYFHKYHWINDVYLNDEEPMNLKYIKGTVMEIHYTSNPTPISISGVIIEYQCIDGKYQQKVPFNNILTESDFREMKLEKLLNPC